MQHLPVVTRELRLPRLQSWCPAAVRAAWLLLVPALLFSVAPASSANGELKGGEHEFYFTRGIYGEDGIGATDWGPRWAVDFPKADKQFLVALRRLTIVDAYESDNAVGIGDASLRDFPFVYVLEVGSLSLSDAEAKSLRDYLLAGGFMVIDDFWGSWAWQNLEEQMQIGRAHV